MKVQLAAGVERFAHLDIEGGGQVVVDGNYAFIGHMKPPHGTSIVDVSDPRRPRVCARLEIGRWSHSHKVRVCGELMITNVEQDRRHYLRRGSARLTAAREDLARRLGRAPEAAEIAAELGIEEETLILFNADNGAETLHVIWMREDHGHDPSGGWRGTCPGSDGESRSPHPVATPAS